MGRPKLLLELEGKPLLRWSVEGVRRYVDDVVVVTGPDDVPTRAALTGITVRFAKNTRPEEGQGTSIAVGAAALSPETDGTFVVLGDQPRLYSDVIPALLAAWRRSGKQIVAPVYKDGVQGNPVFFAASVFDELRLLSGDSGAREIVRRDPSRTELVPVDHPMPLDIDTPADYARLSSQVVK